MIGRVTERLWHQAQADLVQSVAILATMDWSF